MMRLRCPRKCTNCIATADRHKVSETPSLTASDDQGNDMTFRIAISLALLAVASAVTSTAHASSMTGQQLLSLCTANMSGNGNPLEAAECLGFVVGVSDTFNCTQNDHGFTWDSKVNVSQPALVATVVQWLQAHPAALEYEGHRVVGAALQASFPCKK